MRRFLSAWDRGLVIACLVVAGAGLVWKHWRAIAEFAGYAVEQGPWR